MNASMRTILGTSFIGWIIAAVLGLVYLYTFDGGRIKLRPERVKFGIDLVGGTYITLEVQTEKAIEVELTDKVQSVLKKMEEANHAVPVTQSQDKHRVIWKFDSVQNAQQAVQFVAKNEQMLVVTSAENFIQQPLDLNDLVIKHATATFFVKVIGDSMIDAGIRSNDILIVDRSLTPTNNKVVVVRINDEFTVKRIQFTADKIMLLADNDNYKPIEVTKNTDFEIWGVVTFVIHQL